MLHNNEVEKECKATREDNINVVVCTFFQLLIVINPKTGRPLDFILFELIIDRL